MAGMLKFNNGFLNDFNMVIVKLDYLKYRIKVGLYLYLGENED